MGTSSDDVRNYIAGLEADRRELAEVRAMIDVFRRNVLPDSSVTNRVETDAEVIARMAGWEKTARCMEGDVAYWKDRAAVADAIVKRGLHDTEARDNGIRLGLRAAAILASDHDHDCGDGHDACLNALATKILGTTAEGARSMVEVYDRSKTYTYKLTEVNAFGMEAPPPGKPIVWSRPIDWGVEPKPCPLKDCDLPCDDGHKHLVEKTDEPRPPATTTISGPKRVKLRVGQIWRLPAGGERQLTGDLWSGIPGSVSLGGASICIDQDNYVTDTGGCTLVYDPRP